MNHRTAEKIFSVIGWVAISLYIIHVLLGPLVWEGYSHWSQAISELTALGAPHSQGLGALTIGYGILSIVVSSYLVYRLVSGSRLVKLASLMFLFMHLISFSYVFFPQDLPGEPMSFSGIMHIIVTGLLVPLTIASPILWAKAVWAHHHWRRFSRFSVAVAIALFLFGGATAASAAQGASFFGFLERLNIGSLLLWMTVLYSQMWRVGLPDGIKKTPPPK